MADDHPEAVVENLRQERLNVQKRTFTKWANFHLAKYGLQINDLFQDLGDGLKLMKLLESLTGEKLGKPAKGSARINKIENVSRCLVFLHSKKTRLENISSEDIVDGKPHLILGLLWTIILRCEISESATKFTPPEDGSLSAPERSQPYLPVPKIAKDSLLLWCQTKTNGYPGVRVKDFHRSWRDGLAFNALIHSHIPTLVDFHSLKPHEHIKNLENAFTTATTHIGVPRYLEPEDVDTDNPDEKSILMYVSAFSKGLENKKKGMTGGKRISNVLLNLMEIDEIKENYINAARQLLLWINSKVDDFTLTEPLQSLEDIQKEIAKFKDYRTKEKPKKYDMKNEIEALLFAIQMKRLVPVGWNPPEDVAPAEIERTWDCLERAEHEHEIAIRNHLKEQEKIETLAYKFESKRSVRESYLNDMQKILTDPNYGTNIKQADATFKKHEAIRTGILGREIMIKDLFKIADALINSNYRRKNELINWKKETEEKWNYLLRLLEAYDEKFDHLRQVISLLEEMDLVLEEIKQLEAEMSRETEPLDIESSLQRQALREVQMASWGETIRRLEARVDKHEKMKDANVLHMQLGKLRQANKSLLDVSAIRRDELEALLKSKQQLENLEEMMAWIYEKQLYCSSDLVCKDLASVLNVQKTHKSISDELRLRKGLSEEINEARLQQALSDLEKSYEKRSKEISLAIEIYQYNADADDCASRISKKLHLIASLDCGSDELTCESLLRRHMSLEDEALTYSDDVERLRKDCERICSLISKPVQDVRPASKRQLRGGRKLGEDDLRSPITPEEITRRQSEIENSLEEFKKRCEERRNRLQQSCMYFRFKDGCEQIEKWMREKERVMDTNDFGSQAEEVENCFEAFITDMAAHGVIIDELKNIAETLETEKSDHAQTAKLLLDDVLRRWHHLNEITSLKEKNLKGFTSLLLAHRMCDETSSWLNEQCNLDRKELHEDIKSFDSLRRKKEAIGRELVPAEERVKQALVLAENVANSYPDQKTSIQSRMRNLEENWDKFQCEIKKRQEQLEESAGRQIFEAIANALIEWANLMVVKLNVREKISDMDVAQNVFEDHKNLGDEINSMEDRFIEVEELGMKIRNKHKEVESVLNQLEDANTLVHDLWREKEVWLRQSLDFQIFNREANQLYSMCANQDGLLETADMGDTLRDVEILLKHHEAFSDTFRVQDVRYEMFNEMTEKLIAAKHSEAEFIAARRDQVMEYRQNIRRKAEERKLLLQHELAYQQFKVSAQEMASRIAEKDRLASELLKQDSTTTLSYKMKRQQTFEAELAANKNSLESICAKGENMLEESDYARESIISTIEELTKAWNVLIDRIEINRQTLQRANDLRQFNIYATNIHKKLDEVARAVVSSDQGHDLRSVKRLMKDQETLETEVDKIKTKVSLLTEEGQKLMEEDATDAENILSTIEEIQYKMNTLDLSARRKKLETCLKFHQFKSEVDRELLWISEHKTTLSADTTCRSLLYAQKLQKKMENLEVTLEVHKAVIEKLLQEVLVLVAEEESPVNVSEACRHMEEEWNKLLEAFYAKKEKCSATLKVQMFYCEAGEIDLWISEKLEVLSNTDYGKDEDAVIKLLTKQKTLELEIDSYKGLVEELASQAESLIESNHPDAKIVKNRMEVINQEMMNIHKLCSVRRQKLLESKSLYEFQKETEELKAWINELMTEATSEDYGEDYEHVLVLHSNFEFFRLRVETGSKKIIQYEDFAKRLINSNCFFVEEVKTNLEYLSAKWSELVECIEARAFKMEAAAEIHRYHRDVTDILSRIHNYYRGVPQDLGNNLRHVEDLLKKHEKIENELLGLEAQVHLLLEDSRRLQETYPGGNEEHIQMQLALVIENWNLLQQKETNRKEHLLISHRVHKFLTSVREEESWGKGICLELESESVSRDIEQMERDHQILGSEIQARVLRFQPLFEEAQSLLQHEIFQSQVKEKHDSLKEIEKKIEDAWKKRSTFVQQKKEMFLFFHEAKQIQASYAKREVQLCGSETKETVEDLDNALKKHLEFQKSMAVQEEKFLHWKQQGESLLKQNVPESQSIQEKISELSDRRKRLLDFSSERSKSLSDALNYAKFKRDTIEAQSWIQDKKNKLRIVLRDYKQLSTEEKIKCLQKQQAIQAELDVHEPVIDSIIKQSKELPLAGEEVKVRLQLILEDWTEVKENASRMGNDLKEARDMLVIHDYFDKAEAWIKEKELMIQANHVGKDYEHCVSLQNKLNDVNINTKIDDRLLQQMQELAAKLSRNEDQKGVYVRYERINDRWNWLKQEIEIYRKKLEDAAQVHAFVKDVDDTVERIREKKLILSAREEVKELSAVEVMQRKLEMVEKDLTVLDQKIKKQKIEGDFLAEQQEFSAGRIYDKIDQAEREWLSLQEELETKKTHMYAVHTSFKFVKDVNDFEKTVNELITEMEFAEVPSDSTDAQSSLRVHNDLKPQITSLQEKIQTLLEEGKAALRLPGIPVKDVEKSMTSLRDLDSNLQNGWDARQKLLCQCRDLQTFIEKAKQISTWLSSKEAFLANEDLGDSMSSVEALIRKHENFEESCFAHFQKVRELEQLANDLSDHSDFEVIQSWCDEICERRDVLQVACKQRKDKLNDAKALQQLMLEIYEISNWLTEKIKVVSDESYGDLTNLLSKTQKHAAFEAEILANHSRVVAVTEQADKLLEAGHYASEEIHKHIQNVENLWTKLMDNANQQKQRMKEASNALQFKHKLDDINSWIEETEAHLQFENYGSDASSLEKEMHNVQEFMKDSENFSENLRMLSDFAESFQKSDYPAKDEIISYFKTTFQRFRSLETSLQEKDTKLQEELLLANLDTDIADELSWIEENIALCNSEEYFDDVVSVQALQKKLQALETEMISREPLIASVVERGLRSHYAAAERKVKGLSELLQELKAAINLRRLRLADALEAQTYYFEATQAEMWIKEKLSQATSYNAERDVHSVQNIQKKLSAIEAATDAFRQSMQALQDLSSSLISRGHFDSQNMQMKQDEVNDLYEQLRQTILKKTAVLREKEDFFLFERDVKDALSQIRTMSNVANSADQGRDVEHVESLLQKFEAFRNKLSNYENNVLLLHQRGNVLVEEGHSESQNAEQLLQDLELSWQQCSEAADARYKALEEARMIHSFNKSVDETISWIHEKDVVLSSDDYGHDLESIKALLKQHSTLEGDLKAIGEQVQALEDEIKILSRQFPDSKEKIATKYEVVTDSWRDCKEKAVTRKDKLQQAEQLQSYFDEARDIQAWICEMLAVITSSELPKDVAACEALLAQHEGYKTEIEARNRSFYLFEDRGEEIINSGHFMAEEIRSKIEALRSSLRDLQETWKDRRIAYEKNLDLQLFKKKICDLEKWLQGQEHNLVQEEGRSVEEVDYLIRKHEEFEKKLQLYEVKFQELMETTKLEEELRLRKDTEHKRKAEEEQLQEQQKLEEIRRKEEERLLEERKRERTETEITAKEESDDDFLPPDSSPAEEQYFVRIGSRRSFPEQPPARTGTPVIPRKKISVSSSSNNYSLVPPPTAAEGFLERKQEFQFKGKRSTLRPWKTYYTVLCGQLLCFFKDKKSFMEQKAAKAPINILGATCMVPKDYHKKKYVFRLEPRDESSYLFEAPNDIKRNEWMQKINFAASLHPSMQLMTREDQMQLQEEQKNILKEEDSDSLPEEEKDFENDLYDTPYEETERTSSVTSYDHALCSARSSLSNQSSYRTALASTSSSISTLQDENTESSDDEYVYSVPDSTPVSTPRGSEISIDERQREELKKNMSLPKEIEAPHKQTEAKRKGWKVFSLRRRI